MPLSAAEVLPLLRAMRRRLDGDLSLAALARSLGRSPFSLHRAFQRVTGETTKHYTARLRLDLAATALVLGARSVLRIALDHGFASHEVFSRAFVRRFGLTPRAYRTRGLVGPHTRSVAARHAAVVRDAGPCVGLHHLSLQPRPPTMPISITRRQLDPQPALVIRCKALRAEIAAALSSALPKVFELAQRRGIPLAGPPMARYTKVSLGSLVLECGFPVAVATSGDGEVEAIELPGGPAAVAIHIGAYDRLVETHAALEAWIAAEQCETAGPPWESYITDPGDKPDPADWQTLVVYPLAR